MSEAVDQEIDAIKTVLAVLVPLEPAVRNNVLEYVLKRLGLSLDVPPRMAGLPEEVAGLPAREPAPQLSPSSVTDIKELIKDLKARKKPRSANEMAALVAYFLSDIAPQDKRKQNVNADDIKTYFKIAEFPLPKQPKATLPNAKNAGYFDLVGDGEYRLNPVGHNLVVHSMPRGAGSTEPGRRARRTLSLRKAKRAARK
jgi:hypothetical protein